MMRKTLLALAVLFVAAAVAVAEEYSWKAKWISKSECQSESNAWLAFRKHVDIGRVPASVVARIAVDSKYWLWINGRRVVFEGGLKRGPSVGDGYYDKVEIAPYLREGDNLISVLVWHFGKNGFSHLNSGTAALLFEAVGPGVEILSDGSWEGTRQPAFQTAGGPAPNYRLPESNVRYDARLFPPDWYEGANPKRLGTALELGFAPGEAPLGKLSERPVPLWKDYGLRPYESREQRGDTIFCRLPYNCQVTPCLKVDAPAGILIRFETDHRLVTGAECVRGEYVTRAGIQEYESFAWMNGEEVRYIIPEGVRVLDLQYRETGYDTEFSGRFSCNDDFLNDYWKRAQRTLYVCMRDTWYDCPDRERAQWWGDEVNELGEAFYAFSRSSDLLARKGILELAAWQKPDGSLVAPIPCGNYYKELPMQILASVGWYGFRNYYWYSGDSTFVARVYGPMRKYLHDTWKRDGDGMPVYRTGDWDWPDAGQHQDGHAQLPLWYYLALKGERCFAALLGRTEDVAQIDAMMERIASVYNRDYWTGTAYATPGRTDVPDDRVQALAIVSGIASPDKYPALVKVFDEQYHATTYMQRYVLEALCLAGEPERALNRMRKLYPTVMKPGCSTLYEHWNFEGTSNHAWTGAAIIVLGGKIAGIEPTAPGFRTFRVQPQMGDLTRIETAVDTHYGPIEAKLDRKGRGIDLALTVPEGTRADVPAARGRQKSFGPGVHRIRLTL